MSVITKDLGIASAYGYAKSKGYTGTEEEFAELMANYADVAQQAEAAAQDAEDAKDEAVTAKTDAQTAKTAAQAAQSAAETASGTASAKASEAAQSAQSAAGSASAAQTSATAASGSAQTAQTAAQTATTKASEASSSASAASTAKTGAETARTGAQTAQTAAETAQANAEAAASSVSASAAQIEQNTEEIGAIKNDLSEKADKSEALSAYIVETATGSIASFSDGADDVPVKDLTVAIEPVQSGSGDPSPSNVRPISGWTGANVRNNQKNFADYDVAIFSSDIKGLIFGGHMQSGVTVLDGTFVLPSGTYTVSANATLTAWYWGDATGVERGKKYGGTSYTFTLAETKAIWLKLTKTGYESKDDYEALDIQIEVGSTATAYEPYQGETYEVDWTAEAGTVYGGILNVTTGVLTVDRAVITMDGTQSIGNNGALSYGGIQVVATPSPAKKLGATNAEGLLSDKFKIADIAEPYTLVGRTSNANLVFNMPTDVTSIELAKTWFTNNPTQVSYLLATPQTFQLTAHEVSTILGQNNIFADTGKVTVQYRADTKLYIDTVVNA